MFGTVEDQPIYDAANDPQSLGDVRGRQDNEGSAGCHAKPQDGKALRMIGKVGATEVNAVLAD
jgi:hypothetical protein